MRQELFKHGIEKMNLSIIEILMARFCHDIIGPIGAINNGSEFFRDEFPDTKSQAIDLIESSGKEAVARVQFYRQAYGILPDGVADFNEMKELVNDFFSTTKVNVQWHGQNDVEVGNLLKKLLLNLLILANGCLIRGGIINITLGSNQTKLEATGDRVVFNDKLAEVLKSGNAEPLDAKTIQAFYTYSLLQGTKLAVSIESDKDSVRFIISQ